MACHLGVLTDLPCIGVAKKLLQVDGLENNAQHKEKVRSRPGAPVSTLRWGSPCRLMLATSSWTPGLGQEAPLLSVRPLSSLAHLRAAFVSHGGQGLQL